MPDAYACRCARARRTTAASRLAQRPRPRLQGARDTYAAHARRVRGSRGRCACAAVAGVAAAAQAVPLRRPATTARQENASCSCQRLRLARRRRGSSRRGRGGLGGGGPAVRKAVRWCRSLLVINESEWRKCNAPGSVVAQAAASWSTKPARRRERPGAIEKASATAPASEHSTKTRLGGPRAAAWPWTPARTDSPVCDTRMAPAGRCRSPD